MRLPTLILAAAALFASCTPGLAWSGGGHRVIGLIAYARLDPATRARVANLIREHERFDRDFAPRMPEGVRNGSREDQDRWLFSQASIWPDIARDFHGRDRDRYHHSTWHYINEPLYLSEDDRDALENSLPTNLSRNSSAPVDELNIMQALKLCQAKLADDSVSKSEKAIYVCWIFHLVEDLHQPMHSAALFSRERFPSGDRGGNLLNVRSRKRGSTASLHATWDRQLGTGNYNDADRLATDILHDDELQAVAEAAASSSDPEVWLEESYDAAWEYAYDEKILAEVEAKEDNFEARLSTVRLPNAYFQKANDVARRRAAESGYRLALLLAAVE